MNQVSINFNTPNEKITLHDGEEIVKKITFIGLFRNSEIYLSNFFFKMVNVLEKTYNTEFEFFFLENNSNDNTREVLVDWIQEKNGRVFLSNDKSDYEKTSHGLNFSRIKYLADLRNKLINNIGKLDTKWTFNIDSDIFFNSMSLKEFFECKPGSNGYGLVGGYSDQLYNKSVIAKNERDKFTDNTLISINHYYDTFSLFDKNGKSFYPYCPFLKCKSCTKVDQGKNRRELIPESQEIVDVMSCSGGLFLIRSDALNDSRIRWGTISYEPKMDLSICEHVMFCERLRTITGKKIVLLQNVIIYRVHDSKNNSTEIKNLTL
jgi:hypothetical protein